MDPGSWARVRGPDAGSLEPGSPPWPRVSACHLPLRKAPAAERTRASAAHRSGSPLSILPSLGSRADAGEPNVQGKQSTGAISTIRSASTPPRAVKSSVRLGERKAARQCRDPRETLFLCLKSPASCHLAPVSSLFSHTCSSSRSHCPGHVSEKKRGGGGGGGRRRDVEKRTPTPISRKKEKKKKSGLFLDALEPRSWRPGEVRGVCAKERSKQ